MKTELKNRISIGLLTAFVTLGMNVAGSALELPVSSLKANSAKISYISVSSSVRKVKLKTMDKSMAIKKGSIKGTGEDDALELSIEEIFAR